MKGVVLDFNEDTSRGIIAADDGRRYEFAGINWLSERYPGSGIMWTLRPRTSEQKTFTWIPASTR